MQGSASAPHPGEIAYRPDIDGLRALAVIVVVLFHARLGVFSGGYTGVDVFFVISGFLITSIIWREAQAGKFSIASFYERRIRRIFPALAVVVAATLAVGALILAPHDFFLLGRSARATAAFYSNFYFNSQFGYFAPGAETQPLLHTWSLAVEEQFYLVAPLFLILLLRMASQHRTFLFFALLSASFAASAWGALGESKSAFFLPHSRAFELMIGMGLALGFQPAWRNNTAREGAAILGILLIAAASLLYSDATPFPGIAALAPCLGTALLISSATGKSTAVSRILSNSALVSIGKISYSLYLWHWPLFVFGEYLYDEPLPLTYRFGLIALAVALSILTYHFIEQPARRRTLLSQRGAIGAGVAAMAVLLGLSQGVIETRGWPQRLSPEIATFADLVAKSKMRPPCMDPEEDSASAAGCTIGAAGAADPTFLFWGDSHGVTLAPRMADVAAAKGVRGAVTVSGGCAPLLPQAIKNPLYNRMEKCRRMSRRVQDMLAHGAPGHVVIVGRWSYYFLGGYGRGNNENSTFDTGEPAKNYALFAESLKDTINAILATGRKVTLFGPIPELKTHLPNAMMKAMMRGEQRSFDIGYEDFMRRQGKTLRLLADLDSLRGVRVIYPHKILCDKSVCRTTTAEGLPYYIDDDHMGAYGSKAIEGALGDAIGFDAPFDDEGSARAQ
jgi:peptidoglycan/LPS O-acetylase OafA/YrhL